MKKGLVIGLVSSLVIAVGATLAFAQSPAPGMMDKGQMSEMHMVEQHVKDGVFTPEQAKAMDEHMANMGSMMNGIMGGNANCQSSQQATVVPQQ